GAVDVGALLGEGGRIADHDVPPFARGGPPTEVLEHVRLDEVRRVDREAVRDAVLPRELERGRGRVDVDGASGAAREGGDREGARVGEEVEHGAAVREGTQSRPVLALVEEEARLLPRADVGDEAEPVLEEGPQVPSPIWPRG